MYPRPKFLEILIEIRESMAREADFDLDLFAEQLSHGNGDVKTRLKASKDIDGLAKPPKLKKRRSRSKLRA